MLIIKSKYKICKRFGAGVFEQCQTQRYSLSETRFKKQKGEGRRGGSDYGRQMIEKQKARFMYGLSEEQFSRYVKTAMEARNPGSALISVLERRLDNTVFRLGLAPTRRAARQLVSHGHIIVNGKKINIASHIVSVGDVVAVREGSKGRTPFQKVQGGENEAARAAKVPTWLNFDRSSLSGKISADPQATPGESFVDYAAIFEFYSR